eukprot:g5132.t1
MTHPVVLVVGVESVRKHALIEYLTNVSLSKEDCKSAVWKITTKYYEVEVELQTGELTAETAQELSEVNCEAVVVMADCHLERSFHEVKHWFDELRSCKSPSASVQLFVLDWGCMEEINNHQWIHNAKQWALDRGFESIEVSTMDAELETKFTTADDQGLGRVRSALEAHVWPGYNKPSSSRTSNPLPADRVDQKEEEEEQEVQFEKLITELSSARERIQSLPDGERREAAAEMAMRLAQYFTEDNDL